MRNPTILKSWLFVFPLAAALTGCTSLDAKTGAGRAAPGSLELKVGYGSEQPVELQVPVPDPVQHGNGVPPPVQAASRGHPALGCRSLDLGCGPVWSGTSGEFQCSYG